MKTNFEKKEKAEIKINISLSNQEFEKYRDLGVKKVQEVVAIDGFRKGHAPENIIVSKYGEMIILEEMAQLAIAETFYTAILKENNDKKEEEKIIPLGQPQINITKIGKGSDFEYTATLEILPFFNLEDYKKISKKVIAEVEEKALEDLQKKNVSASKDDLLKVSEEEVEAVIQDLRKARTTHNHEQEKREEDSDNKENLEQEQVEKTLAEIEEHLPVVDDAFAKSFGEHFETVEALRNKIKENLALEKKSKLIEKKRTSILEKLVEQTQIEIPKVLIQDELERIKAQMQADIERFGGKWEEYLTQIKKTEEDLRKEWQEVAQKRVSSQLIVNQIAKKEEIKVNQDEIEVEAIKIISQMPEAEEKHVHNYVEQILINEKVMRLLDGEVYA